MRASFKDISRTILKERKRFIAIAVIAILGITMFSGLQAGCDDLRLTADRFFDDQNLHDIYIQSTLGLTKEDVESLQGLEEIEQASGFYSEEVQTLVDGVNKIALIKVIDSEGMDAPYLLEGQLPESADEVLVTRKYLDETGKKLGDVFDFEETDLEDDENSDEANSDTDEKDMEEADEGSSDKESSDSDSANKENSDSDDEFDLDPSDYEIEEESETPTFPQTSLTIVGVVIDPTDINADQGSTAFRSTSDYDYVCYVLSEAVDTEIYKGIGVTIAGMKAVYCYSDRYDFRNQEVMNLIADRLKTDREAARTQEIKDEAYDTIADVENDMKDAFSDVEKKFKDAKKELEDGEQELKDGQQELDDNLKKGEDEIADGRKQISDGYDELEAAEKKLKDSEKKLDEGEAELKDKEALLASKEKELEAGEAKIADAMEELASNENALASQRASFEASKDYLGQEEAAAMEAQLLAAEKQLASGRKELEAQSENLKAGRKELESGKQQLEAGKKEIEDGRAQIESGKKEISDNKKKLDDNLAKLNREEAKMYAEIEKAQKEIDDGWKELEDGQKEYQENWETYQEKKADAENQIADAKAEVEDLESAKWYIQNRFSLSGYNNVKNDMSAIESLGIVFAFIFLVVAVLISLTTITRMVEEDRGLIGTYQALGYSNAAIRRKYMLFALFACFIGCALGELCGFWGFPKVLAMFFGVMYQLPAMQLAVNWPYFFAGPAIFMVCIALAVFLACHSSLRFMPAALMRPKAPKAGSRVFLEYIPLIWNRMNFLNKVTARNLFRYKKRFLMTIIGISACNAILIGGFGIKDTVVDLMSRQYDQISQYDWLGLVDGEDMELLEADLHEETSVQSYMKLSVASVSLINETGETMIIPLYVVEDPEEICDYIQLEDISSGDLAALSDEGILVTRNAGIILGFQAGDRLTIQDNQFYTQEYEISAVVENYLGNMIFMTRKLFDQTFDGYEANACLAKLDDQGDAFVAAEKEKDMILSSVSTKELKGEFSTSFALLNMVVYLIIVMAAALALVVLFTLSTTNISERERELATIKVLGFYDREVHTYVNKETMLLTLMGIACGVPMGIAMLQALTNVLKMPELYFAASIHKITYVYACLLTFVFAILVNQLTNRTLNAVDPVEALKSIE